MLIQRRKMTDDGIVKREGSIVAVPDDRVLLRGKLNEDYLRKLYSKATTHRKRAWAAMTQRNVTIYEATPETRPITEYIDLQRVAIMRRPSFTVEIMLKDRELRFSEKSPVIYTATFLPNDPLPSLDDLSLYMLTGHDFRNPRVPIPDGYCSSSNKTIPYGFQRPYAALEKLIIKHQPSSQLKPSSASQ